MDHFKDFDKRFEENRKQFDRDFARAERLAQIGACLSVVFFLLLFALMIAGIFWLVSNA